MKSKKIVPPFKRKQPKCFYTKTELPFRIEELSIAAKTYLEDSFQQAKEVGVNFVYQDIPALQISLTRIKKEHKNKEEIFVLKSCAAIILGECMVKIFKGRHVRAADGCPVIAIPVNNEDRLYVDLHSIIRKCYESKNQNYLASKIDEIEQVLLPLKTAEKLKCKERLQNRLLS